MEGGFSWNQIQMEWNAGGVARWEAQPWGGLAALLSEKRKVLGGPTTLLPLQSQPAALSKEPALKSGKAYFAQVHLLGHVSLAP